MSVSTAVGGGQPLSKVIVTTKQKKKKTERCELVCKANLKPCFQREIITGNNLFTSLKNLHTKRFNYGREDKALRDLAGRRIWIINTSSDSFSFVMLMFVAKQQWAMTNDQGGDSRPHNNHWRVWTIRLHYWACICFSEKHIHIAKHSERPSKLIGWLKGPKQHI